MAEQTYIKSRVSFRMVASGTFVVDHVEGESAAAELKRLVEMRGLSLVDLYLHGDEFEWKLEATDENDERELDDLERQREQMERDEIADALDQQWNDR